MMMMRATIKEHSEFGALFHQAFLHPRRPWWWGVSDVHGMCLLSCLLVQRKKVVRKAPTKWVLILVSLFSGNSLNRADWITYLRCVSALTVVPFYLHINNDLWFDQSGEFKLFVRERGMGWFTGRVLWSSCFCYTLWGVQDSKTAPRYQTPFSSKSQLESTILQFQMIRTRLFEHYWDSSGDIETCTPRNLVVCVGVYGEKLV